MKTFLHVPCVRSIAISASVVLFSMTLSACGGGGSSTTSPNTATSPAGTSTSTQTPSTPTATVGPARAATCPSAAANLTLSCTQGTTPATAAQVTAIVGTYGTSPNELFVTNRGTVYFGASPTEYTPAGGICQVGSADTIVMYFSNAANSRLIYTIGSSAVTVTGNVPNTSNTSLTAQAQTSCQY
jgi:hypothetical protein